MSESRVANGFEDPSLHKRMISVRLSPQVFQRLRRRAIENGVSFATVAREMIDLGLERVPNE